MIDPEDAPMPGAMAQEFKPLPELSAAEKKRMAEAEDFERQRAAVTEAREVPIYFDGDKYWSKLPDERWVPDKKEDAAANIMQEFGITKPQLVQEVMFYIRKKNRVDGATPFIHNKGVTVVDQNGLYLNTTRRKLTSPAEQDGDCPWLHTYFEKIWDSSFPQQREIFLAWFKRLYQSAHEGNLKSGQALIIAGDTGLGKTLLSRRIIGAALGGFTDAGSYLLGKTEFNKEAAETAVWSVDDNRGGATWEKHDEFSNALKRYVANPQIPYHPKFKDATTITWRGRIVVTCNLDEKSLSILPEMDESIEDKLMLFKLNCWRPDFKNVEAVIEAELPFFLRWLLEWKPTSIRMDVDERFGITSFHHPELLFASRSAAAPAQLEEMITYAIPRGLVNDKKEKCRWMSATEIYRMLEEAGLRGGLNKFQGNRMGVALSGIGKDYIAYSREVKGRKQYLLNLTPWDGPIPPDQLPEK